MHRLNISVIAREVLPAQLRICCRPRKIWKILESTALVMSLTSLLTQTLVYTADSERAAWFIPLVDLDHELSLPSIFSTLLFFITAFLLILISRVKMDESDPFRWHWLGLCLISLCLCFDEGASIHELVSVPAGNLMAAVDLPGFRQYAWVLPVGVLVALAAVAYLKFLFALPGATRRWLVLAVLVYLGGALGMETLGATYSGLHGMKNLAYNVFVTIEEFMEMSGLVLILYALLDYVGQRYNGLLIRLKG